jgi:hypothetical protein
MEESVPFSTALSGSIFPPLVQGHGALTLSGRNEQISE